MKKETPPDPDKPYIVAYGDVSYGHTFYGPFANLAKAIEFQNENFPNDWCGTNALRLHEEVEKEEDNDQTF